MVLRGPLHRYVPPSLIERPKMDSVFRLAPGCAAVGHREDLRASTNLNEGKKKKKKKKKPIPGRLLQQNSLSRIPFLSVTSGGATRSDASFDRWRQCFRQRAVGALRAAFCDMEVSNVHDARTGSSQSFRRLAVVPNRSSGFGFSSPHRRRSRPSRLLSYLPCLKGLSRSTSCCGRGPECSKLT